MFLYNVHTPLKTFALPHKEDESYASFVDRISKKAGLDSNAAKALNEGKDGAGIAYEFEGGRFSLEDDDDFSILHSRLSPDSASSATLHLTTPRAHAHFAPSPAPPAYTTASSTIKAKAAKRKTSSSKSSSTPISAANEATAGKADNELGPPAGGVSPPKVNGSVGKPVTISSILGNGKPKSIASTTRSRRSKWGNDDAEPMGDVHKRQWIEFQNNQGVRTVVGKVGDVPNVRMLLKSGYRQVYLSRSFATKHGFVPPSYSMGAAGYTGLKTIGKVSITVGSHTASHPALINEEEHFDVVLGRAWLEKMNIKIDPLDQTNMTYMDNGEVIPCDLVVLKDADGNVITIT
ncbi:hypothetical protein BCR39DRAFT_528368 [Naematelia encephala]|uniref:Uncharacterized protein n=1 Tax=Naematelia encephala TaxID=71784 RepID=A0A1Y2B8H6_9TREE|nr:hypothetical protein BCR39DRAFT_528368 [Naematelia encephala]